MNIEQLKQNIQNNTVSDDLIIFTYSDSSFIAWQYINEISRIKNLKKSYCDSLEYIDVTTTMFDSLVEPILQVCYIEKFDYSDIDLIKAKNTIIVCNKVLKASEKIYSKFIINIPKLEEWQVKDFIFSKLDGMSEDSLETLAYLCKNNAFRAQMEIDRLLLFDQAERNSLFKKFTKDFIYGDLTKYNIFDYISALVKKDIDKATELYIELSNIEHSSMGITKLLYNNFKNIILVQCGDAISPDTCGLTANQFWAIKNNTGNYTKDQLKHIFITITDIDRKLKLGELDEDMIMDYLFVNILK